MRKPTASAATAAALVRKSGAIARALTGGLELPLQAIRASVENLHHEFGREPVGARRLDGVLRGVERLGRNVDGLLELAEPPTLHPLACTPSEIVGAARQALDAEDRSRVQLACTQEGAPLRLDGPLVSVCLRRLIENSLEAGSETVLVSARTSGDQLVFAVVDDAPEGLESDWKPVPFLTTKPNHLGLGLTLTQRDVALLGGALTFHATRAGATCVRITVPCLPESIDEQ
jgi:signal transduction histidine kinase